MVDWRGKAVVDDAGQDPRWWSSSPSRRPRIAMGAQALFHQARGDRCLCRHHSAACCRKHPHPRRHPFSRKIAPKTAASEESASIYHGHRGLNAEDRDAWQGECNLDRRRACPACRRCPCAGCRSRRDAARQSLRILYAAGRNSVSILYGLRAFSSDATVNRALKRSLLD